MPKISSRELRIRQCEEDLDFFTEAVLMEEDCVIAQGKDMMEEEEEEDSDVREAEAGLEAVFAEYIYLLSCRYSVDRMVTPKSREFMRDFFGCQRDREFRQSTRMDKRAFKALTELLQADPIFHNNSQHEQAPVHLQVACALEVGQHSLEHRLDYSHLGWL